MKYLPETLRHWYFPFNWNVKDIWTIDGDVNCRPINQFTWHLNEPLWSSVSGKGMLFDLKPRQVLENPEQHQKHMDRILQADVTYPVCVVEYRDREIIIDGLHRLARLVLQNADQIDVKVISEHSLREVIKVV